MTRTPLSARGAAAVALLLATSCSDSGPHGPGAPVSLALVSGDAQSSTVASPLPLPITIRVADGASRATPGILVRFAVASGGGQVAAATASTNDSGLVHATWTLGVAAGEQSLTATLSADPALATIVHATATPDAPAALELLDTLSSTAPVGAPVAAHLRVALVDRFDNASPVAGVEITASLDDGAGGPSARNQLRGAVTAMTNASGLADFTQLTIVGDTGAVSLAFRAPALKSASARLRVVTGVPARLDVVGPTTVAGVVAQNGTPLRVRAVDASGNAVAGVRVAFAFVNTNLQTVTDASGIASFAQWTIPTKAGTYQLVASAPNLPSVIFGVTASAGPPAGTRAVDHLRADRERGQHWTTDQCSSG